MKTIDERAKMAACDCIEWYARKELKERNPNGCTDAILKALKEQRAIDIDKACEWIKDNFICVDSDIPSVISDFLDAMTE